jgi:hypothetical protein
MELIKSYGFLFFILLFSCNSDVKIETPKEIENTNLTEGSWIGKIKSESQDLISFNTELDTLLNQPNQVVTKLKFVDVSIGVIDSLFILNPVLGHCEKSETYFYMYLQNEDLINLKFVGHDSVQKKGVQINHNFFKQDSDLKIERDKKEVKLFNDDIQISLTFLDSISKEEKELFYSNPITLK